MVGALDLRFVQEWRERLSFHDLPTLGPPGNLIRYPTSGES